MRQPLKHREKIQLIFSLFIYSIVFILLLLPWMQIGEERFTLLKLATTINKSNAENFFISHEIVLGDITPNTLYGGIKVSLSFYMIYALLSGLYVVTVLIRKNWNVNLAVLLSSIMLAYTGSSSAMLGTICTNLTAATLFPFSLLILSTIETIGRKIIENWEETVVDARESEERDRLEREERRRRLYFPGKYSRLFTLVVWKNFRNNMKDYFLLLLCNGTVFAFIFTGIGFHRLMSSGDLSNKTGYFVGVGRILFQSIIELSIVGVFMLVLLMLYYLRKRIPQYGVFRTLGIRKKTLFLCIGAELGIGAVISIIAGGVAGSFLIRILQLKTLKDSSYVISTSKWLSPLSLAACLGIVFLIYLVTFFVTHDLFVGFRMGSLTDLAMMKEWIPGSYQIIPLILGSIICAVMMLRNSVPSNYEGLFQLVLTTGGLYLIVRFGIALYISHWKKKKNHLSQLLQYHPFFHRSRSTSWYIFGITILQICVLGIFSLQLFSTNLVKNPESYYPYDLVCLANAESEEDLAFIETLENTCDATVACYPMVRISGTDATKDWEGSGQTTVKGQQIGISESTYHQLKAALDPSYTPVDLGLGDSDETIYIVHQQDKSVKAQPIDFRISRKRPYIYPGPVCEYVDPFSHHTNFKRYRVAGEETESLIGAFCEGDRENLVVLADSYFESAKELWKTTDRYTGDILTEPSEIGNPELTFQGPSMLVLVHMDECNLSLIEKELEAFAARHKADEVYDPQIESYYTKSFYLQTLVTALNFKSVMSIILIITFFAASVLLILIKMMTERNINLRRTDFLRCLGMRKKDRTRLLRTEMNVYTTLSGVLAFIISTGFVLGSARARLYSAADTAALMKQFIPFAIGELLAFAAVIWLMTTIQIHQLEKN